MVLGLGLPIVSEMVPALAEAFRPTFLVSQHGCDSHFYDPLAHLRVTTAAYRAATVLLDELAHQWTEGRWFATGGGGYDAYRVVPRSWSLVWLAQAHRPPLDLPVADYEHHRAARVLAHGPPRDQHPGGTRPGRARLLAEKRDLHPHVRENARVQAIEGNPDLDRRLLPVGGRDDRAHFRGDLPLRIRIQDGRHRLSRLDPGDVGLVHVRRDGRQIGGCRAHPAGS